MKEGYSHGSLRFTEENKIVYTSFSKHNFFLRSDVSSFVLSQGNTPISPFLNFDYNLANLVPKDLIRAANNTLIQRSDEMWVFGPISDGMLIEIYLAQKKSLPIRYFKITLADAFQEITAEEIELENVSPWMWQWVLEGKSLERWHPRLRFTKTYPLVYPAYSKKNFFLQMHISQFCIENRVVPLNPFMLFRYFLGDIVPRETVYQANNNIVRICDEVWSFGAISDGVLAEIKLKQEKGDRARFFKIDDSTYPIRFRRTSPQNVPFEEERLEAHRDILTNTPSSPPARTQVGNSHIIPFHDISSHDTVGGKAQSLGALKSAGFTVPDGFVIVTDNYSKEKRTLATAIHLHFDALNAPYVAVRSSAANEDGSQAAWAGQLESFLNITKDSLLHYIERCFNSAQTARAQSYAASTSSQSGQVSVIVQTMVDSAASGVAFSVHPVSGHPGHIVIEAGLGLGEAIVGGHITPDLYIVEKNSGEIVERNITKQVKYLSRHPSGETTWHPTGEEGKKQKVIDDHIQLIATTTTQLEKHFGHPVDSEWAIHDDTLYILQCRPITTL